MSPKKAGKDPGQKGARSKGREGVRQAAGNRKGRRQIASPGSGLERHRRRSEESSAPPGAIEDADVYADGTDESEELDFDHSTGVYSVSGFQDDAAFDDHPDYDGRFVDDDLDFMN